MDLHAFYQARYPNTLAAALLNTPLGEMLAVYSAQGLCLLEFTDRKNIERTIQTVQRARCANLFYQNHHSFSDLQRCLDEYFSQQRTHFHDVKLDIIGTPFQQHTWRVLQTIPYGQTISYTQQAIELGNAKAVRAVAAANGQNKISIIIPCHRVIGRDGRLTGYAGGLPRKQALLQHEQGIDK